MSVQVEVTVRDKFGSVASVRGTRFFPPFVVTRAVKDDPGPWVITHLPTGLAAGRRHYHKDACAIARALSNQPGWFDLTLDKLDLNQTTGIADWKDPADRKRYRALYLAAAEGVGREVK